MKTKKLSIKYTRSVYYNWTMINGAYNLQPGSDPTDGRWPPRGVDCIPDFFTRAHACYFKTELCSRILGAELAHETHAWDHDLLSTQNNCSHFLTYYILVTFPNLGQTE